MFIFDHYGSDDKNIEIRTNKDDNKFFTKTLNEKFFETPTKHINTQETKKKKKNTKTAESKIILDELLNNSQ